MVESLTQRIVGRLAAVLFLLGGSLTIVQALLPAAARINRPGLLAVGGTALALGGFAWLAPWHRWPRPATLALVPPALAMIAVGDPLGGADPYTFGVFFVVVFAWIGVGHRPGTSLAFAPLATVAYVLPLLGDGHGPTALWSAVTVVPLCVLLGEALAWVPTQLRRAERVDARRLADMQSLLEATGRLAQLGDPSDTGDVVADLSMQLLSGQGSLVLMLQERTTLVRAAARRWPGAGDSFEIERNRELASALGGRPLLLPAEAVRELVGEPRAFDSVLVLPLIGSGPAIGAVLVGFRQVRVELDRFTSDVVQTFAAQAALAFERLAATRALIDATLRDELTGLGNRRFANQVLAELHPGDAVALLDFDRLKEINDRFGHPAGDESLRRFGSFLRATLRADDRAARYGGDEFLVILRSVGDRAATVLGRLAREWRAADHRSTFSVGVAVHEPGRLPEQTLIRADSALYRAKEAGRDRVNSFEEEWAGRSEVMP